MADDGEIAGGMAGADATGILAEGDIQEPMDAVLDPPMTADASGERLGTERGTQEVVVPFTGRWVVADLPAGARPRRWRAGSPRHPWD